MAQGPASRNGYLYRYIDYGAGFFQGASACQDLDPRSLPISCGSLTAGKWEMQFFVLVHQSKKLMQFSTEKDVGLAPRGYYDLQGASIEVEGLKKGRYW